MHYNFLPIQLPLYVAMQLKSGQTFTSRLMQTSNNDIQQAMTIVMENSTLPPNVTKDAMTDSGHDVSIDNLYPAIIQCFVIILSGYIAGRLHLLSESQGKGLATFVSYFCLPSLLFKNMCVLNFNAVDWLFLAGVLIAKSLVFLFVVIVTLVAKRPMNFGYAGLFGIFVTQSNDFALGYPISK